MFFWLKIGVLVVLLSIIGGVYYKYEHAISENKILTDNNEKLTQTVKDQDSTITQQKQDADTLQNILVKKAKKEKALNDQVSKLHSTIAELETKDPAVKAWASEPIPASVLDGLRNSGLSDSDQSGQAASTSGAGPANSGPANGPKVQPGPSRLSGKVPSPAANVQQR